MRNRTERRNIIRNFAASYPRILFTGLAGFRGYGAGSKIEVPIIKHTIMKKIITSALFLFALLNARGQYMSFFGDSTWE